MTRRFAVIALVMAAVPTAQADGRYPESMSVSFRPGSTRDLYLGVTFGLLISHDDGASFRWICEQNLGYDDGTYDPQYRVARDGTLYANTFRGLRVSRDGGCSFETATAGAAKTDPGLIAGKWIDTFDVGPDDAVWVGTTDAGRPNEVYRSTDGARTFRPLGLRTTVAWWRSLVVAPGDGRRAFVSNYEVPRPGEAPVHLFRTDDAGATWHPLPTDGFALGLNPLVLFEAVAPGDGSQVFARSVGAAPPTGDVLYRSTDAGKAWHAVLTTSEPIRDVVVRTGGTVWVATAAGLYRSDDGGAAFVPVAPAPRARCLGDRGDALFACGTNWEPDHFALGRSPDGLAWTEVHRFIELAGPVSCPVGTVQHDECERVRWPLLRDSFGLPADDPAPPAPEPPAAAEPAGCCAGTEVGVIGGVGIVAVLLMRRRRRRCCD